MHPAPLGAGRQVTTLAQLTPTTILRWCAGADSPTPLANNTIRGRGLVVSALLEWCDLLDIQKVLHHADPVATMKCYLDPMDTEVLERAARLLD